MQLLYTGFFIILQKTQNYQFSLRVLQNTGNAFKKLSSCLESNALVYVVINIDLLVKFKAAVEYGWLKYVALTIY